MFYRIALVSSRNRLVQKAIKIVLFIQLHLRTHRRLLLGGAMVLFVLATVPLVGILVIKQDPTLIFFAILAPLVLPLLLALRERFELTPLIILIAAAFGNFFIPAGGSQSVIVDSLLLTILFTGIWVLRMLVVEKRLQLKPSPVNVPLVGFICATLFAWVWSLGFRDPLVIPRSSIVSIASMLVIIMLPAALLLVVNHIDHVKLLKAMVAIMLVAAVFGLVWGNESIPQERPLLTINAAGLFTMWLMALAISLAFFNRRLPWLWRGLLLVLTVAWMHWGFVLRNAWLVSWLPAFIAVGILIFIRSKLLTALIILAIVVYVGLNLDHYVTVYEAEREGSGETRLEALHNNWRVTGKHLLFGTGPAGYAAYYIAYIGDPFDHTSGTFIHFTHNTYADIFAQTGIVGLFFFLWFLVSMSWTAFRLARRLKGRGDFAESLANAGLAGMVTSILAASIGDWLVPFAYTQTIAGYDYIVYSWLFMGMIIVLDRLTQTKPGVIDNA